jgi:serine/threonine protein kinase
LIISPSGLPCSSKDQLAKILYILGTPDEEDISFITDNKALEYIKSYPKCKRIDFKVRYPAAPKEAVDFLNRLLVLNPFFRMTLDEAISHPLFDEMRIPVAEKSLEGVESISMDFEEITLLNEEILRHLILKEVDLFKNKIIK